MSMHKALTIAGSDSSGGAGIQADLKTFQEKNVYGMTALTVIVAIGPGEQLGSSSISDRCRYDSRTAGDDC